MMRFQVEHDFQRNMVRYQLLTAFWGFNAPVGAIGLCELAIETPDVVVVVYIAFYEGDVSGWCVQHYLTAMR